ncbi:MAG: 23S rRNA (adenine(2503)-C(2))-methyltransferase RlmN, partial [Deltaproteobacteria bacterium]|nr:23S rRNA (adenine(2503)-C(2))-methyltransferase RlmN [Deltaproteobacteria bacterium]
GTGDGLDIESVLIPFEARITLCVSSQVGCGMACGFCLTGRMKKKRNLSAGEIVHQVYHVARAESPERKISNIVFMGMGEPLDNFDNVVKAVNILKSSSGMGFAARRITVSTSGIADKIAELGEKTDVNLALSFVTPEMEAGARLMPVLKKFPIGKIISELKKYPLKKGRRITIEYIMLKGINDSPDDARRLIRTFADVPVKINLIPFNRFDGAEFEPPETEKINVFHEFLHKKHFVSVIRQSRGTDIGAACGQLDGR